MMSDLTGKHVFSSERRSGIAMAAQEKLDLETLYSHGLVDARFDSADSPMTSVQDWIQSFEERLSQCPAELRHNLICVRPSLPDGEREEFDKELFKKHWLAPDHRQRLELFSTKQLSKKGR